MAATVTVASMDDYTTTISMTYAVVINLHVSEQKYEKYENFQNETHGAPRIEAAGRLFPHILDAFTYILSEAKVHAKHLPA